MEKIAVIVAGGAGLRMGASVPKQFLLIHNKPILFYTLRSFLEAYADLQIVLVLPQEHIAEGGAIVEMLEAKNRIQLVEGGNTRFHSVQYGLQLVPNNAIVFVHDGVRCMVSVPLIQRCYEQAVEKGSAIPAVAAIDSIRIANEAGASQMIDRNAVRMVQTPQTFKSDILLQAFKQPYKENFTDEASVVEATGQQVYLIEGDYNNIKVTKPIDLVIAGHLLSQ